MTYVEYTLQYTHLPCLPLNIRPLVLRIWPSHLLNLFPRLLSGIPHQSEKLIIFVRRVIVITLHAQFILRRRQIHEELEDFSPLVGIEILEGPKLEMRIVLRMQTRERGSR